MATVRILKTDISVTNINEVSEILINEKKIYTAICNANTLVRCYKDENLNKIINSFSIKCPDGFPVASHTDAKTNWINLLSHDYSPCSEASTSGLMSVRSTNTIVM